MATFLAAGLFLALVLTMPAGAGNDFKVQRGEVVLTGTSATITAGVDYEMPADLSHAFIRIVNTRLSGGGRSSAGGNQNSNAWNVSIANPGNLLTSVDFARYNSTNDSVVTWEIVEYIGAAGGANEFIVRDQTELAIASGNLTTQGAAVSVILDDADVVPFITGQRLNAGNRTNTNMALHYSAWDDAGDLPVFTRGESGTAGAVSYAAVEFVGSNWQIVRLQHTESGTETIAPALVDLSRAFIHAQNSATEQGLDDLGDVISLTAADTVTFDVLTQKGQIGVAWVIENLDDSPATSMKVQHITGYRASGGGNPDSWTEAIFTVLDMGNTSIMGESATSTGTGDSAPRGSVNLLLTASDTVTLWQSDSGQNITYSLNVIQWPLAPIPPLTWDGTDNAWMSDHWGGITPAGGEVYIVNGGMVRVQSDPPAAGKLTINGGTVEVQAPWTLSVIDIVKVNGGTLTVAGTLDAATVNVAAGGALDVSGILAADSLTTDGTNTVAATGEIRAAVTLIVNSALDMNGGTLSVDGADVTVAGTLTIDNNIAPAGLVLNGGTLVTNGRNVTIPAGGTLTMQGAAVLDMDGGTLDANDATVRLAGGTLSLDAPLRAALLQVVGGSLVPQGSAVTVTGTLTVDGSDLDMTGAALVAAGADVLVRGNALTLGAALTAANVTLDGGTLVAGGNDLTVQPGGVLTLQGTGPALDMDGGKLDANDATIRLASGLLAIDQTLRVADLQLAGGALTPQAQEVKVTGALALTGSDLDMTGGKLTASGAAITIDPGRDLTVHNQTLEAGTLLLRGTLTRTGADRDLTITDALTLDGNSLDMTGGLLTTTGAVITIEPNSVLTVDNQTLIAGTLALRGNGTFARTGNIQDVVITDALTLLGANLDMTGGVPSAVLTTTGATITIDSNSTLTVDNQTLEAGTLVLQGSLVRTGAVRDLTVTDALTLDGINLDMTGALLTTAGAAVTIEPNSLLTVDNQTLAAGTLILRGSLVRTGANRNVTVTDALRLEANSLDMTGATLTTTGATVLIGAGQHLTVDNMAQPLEARTLEVRGTLSRTGANKDVTVTDALLLMGDSLDMTGAALTTAGARVVIGAGRNLTVDNQALAADRLFVAGTLTRTGANRDVAVTTRLTLEGDSLNMTGATLTADTANIIVKDGRSLTLAQGALTARGVDLSDGGVLDTGGNEDLILSESLKIPGAGFVLSGAPSFTAAWDDAANLPTRITVGAGTLIVAGPGGLIPAGPEMYYSFDDSADPFNDDSPGGNHDATAQTTAPTWLAGGRIYGAVSFDGSDNGLRPSNWGFMEDPFTQVTVGMWFKQDAGNTAGNRTLLDEGGSTNGLGIALEDGVLKTMVRTSGAADLTLGSVDPLSAGWHHVGVVFGRQDSLFELYLDGELIDSGTFDANTIANHTDDPGIGYTQGSNPITSGRYWGLMDELYYYERALTEAEMQAVAGGRLTADLSGLEFVVTGDSGITVGRSTDLGDLRIEGSGSRALAFAGGAVSFNNTTLSGSLSALVIDNSADAHLTRTGGLDAGGADVAISKIGPGELVLSQASNIGAASSFAVAGGTLTAGLPAALDGAPVQIGGGSLLLSSQGGAAAYDNAVAVTGDAAITAGKSVTAGGVDGPLTVTLGSDTKRLSIAPGKTAAIGATDGYTLEIPGAVDDGAGGTGGSLAVRQGAVNLNGGADLTGLDVSDTGQVNLGADITVRNIKVTNSSVHAGSHRVTVAEGGVMEIGLYDTAFYTATAGQFHASGEITKAGPETLILGGAGSVLTVRSLGPADFLTESIGDDTNPNFPNGGSLAAAHPNYNVTASGADIYGTGDGGYFAYQIFDAAQPLDISARVGLNDFQGGNNAWRKSGMMIRASLDANSRNGFTLIAAGNSNGINAQIRPSDAVSTIGATATGPRINHDTPAFLRLTYDGDGRTFSMYYKDLEDDPWILLGTNVLEQDLTGAIYAGLAVTSHNTNQQTSIDFDHLAGFDFNELPVAHLNNLTGEGEIRGSIVVAGELAPGSSLGAIRSESVTFADGSAFTVNLDGADSDVLEITGDLTIGTDGLIDTIIRFVELGPPTAASYTLITWTGTLTGQFDLEQDLPALYHLVYEDNGPGLGGSLLLVPEPASLCLLAVGGLALIRRRRR